MLDERRECGVDVKFLFDFHTQTTASKRGNGATGQRCTQKASSQRRAYVTALLDSHTHPKLFSCTAGQSIRELSSARARDLLRLYLAGSKMICQLWICCGPTTGNGGKWESAARGQWEECRLICLMQLPFNNLNAIGIQTGPPFYSPFSFSFKHTIALALAAD